MHFLFFLFVYFRIDTREYHIWYPWIQSLCFREKLPFAIYPIMLMMALREGLLEIQKMGGAPWQRVWPWLGSRSRLPLLLGLLSGLPQYSSSAQGVPHPVISTPFHAPWFAHLWNRYPFPTLHIQAYPKHVWLTSPNPFSRYLNIYLTIFSIQPNSLPNTLRWKQNCGLLEHMSPFNMERCWKGE